MGKPDERVTFRGRKVELRDVPIEGLNDENAPQIVYLAITKTDWKVLGNALGMYADNCPYNDMTVEILKTLDNFNKQMHDQVTRHMEAHKLNSKKGE